MYIYNNSCGPYHSPMGHNIANVMYNRWRILWFTGKPFRLWGKTFRSAHREGGTPPNDRF